MGPVWDFDVAMGNSIHGRSRQLLGLILPDRAWAERLYRKPAFTRLIARRWRELRRGGLRRDLMRAIDSMSTRLRGPAARNFKRWPILGRHVPPNPRPAHRPLPHHMAGGGAVHARLAEPAHRVA